MNNKNTITMSATFGINKGYFHQNESNVDFTSILQDTIIEVFDETGVYLSFVVHETKTVYNEEFGCPRGGEVTKTIESFCNKEYEDDTGKWMKASILLVNKMKEKLEQEVVYIQFGKAVTFRV